MAFFNCGKRKPTLSKAQPMSVGDKFFKNYEAKLKIARALAFLTNVMYSCNWFLGFCALTWASAVILGGLLQYLSKHDYFSVVTLLVLEAVRLSTVTFFGKFVTWRLVHGSTDPKRLIYNDSTTQKLQGIARILEQAVELTVIDISILVPVRRLQDLKIHSSSLAEMTAAGFGFHGSLKISLRIFYVLVLVNAAIACLAVIFSKNVVPFFVDSPCLRKYYEAVVWKGIDEGLLHATDFEMLSWTFKIQADEYRRNTRAPVVKDLYGDMMKFLYYHPRNKGFEAAKVALESDDTFEREAAANIVGLWVLLVNEVEGWSCKSALSRLLMQKKLLAKLAEALDNDETGRAASISFEKLMEKDPEGILKVRSEGGNEKLADILMDRILETVESKKPKKALTDIKVMIQLLKNRNGHNLEQYFTQSKLIKLKKNLWIIVTEYARDLKRLQVLAAYAYYLLMNNEEGEGTVRDLCGHLRVAPQEEGSYILKDEAHYLFELLHEESLVQNAAHLPRAVPSELGEVLPIEWNGVVEVRAVEDHKWESLPWMARRETVLAASFVNLVVLVVSSYFMIRYAHF